MREPEFTDDDARAAWDEGAQIFDEFVSSGEDYYRLQVHGPALLGVCEPVHGSRALDLGCGQGYFCRQLAVRGGQVTGVDLSSSMIEIAQSYERETPLGIEYAVLSASNIGSRWSAQSFDLVTACMSLQDMASPADVVAGVRAILRDDGRFVFSVPHPATETSFREWERDESGQKLALKVNGYFDGGPASCEWNMPRLAGSFVSPYWRRTLEEWADMLVAAGFAIRRLSEPRPTRQQVDHNLNLLDCYMLPYFLIVEASVV